MDQHSWDLYKEITSSNSDAYWLVSIETEKIPRKRGTAIVYLRYVMCALSWRMWPDQVL